MSSDLQNIDNARAALLEAFESDQYYRSEEAKTKADYLEAWRRSDANNQILLKHIIALHGWPKRTVFGDQAELGAFLIAQHADTEFMQHVFTLRSALPPEEIARFTQPLMEDRLRIRAGQPQKYGTQIFTAPDGRLTLSPIEGIDAEKLLAGDNMQTLLLDSRRKEVGLLPIKSYLERFGIKVPEPSRAYRGPAG